MGKKNSEVDPKMCFTCFAPPLSVFWSQRLCKWPRDHHPRASVMLQWNIADTEIHTLDALLAFDIEGDRKYDYRKQVVVRSQPCYANPEVGGQTMALRGSCSSQ